jgi:hypothetical protein
MAQPKVYNWIAADNAAIALLQTAGAAGSVLLNGTLSVSNNPIVTLPGMVRKLSLTSANNLSAIIFTITGTANGHSVNETIFGPNANTVQTVNYYDSVTSITSNAGFTALSVGIGQTGFTSWFLHDYDRTVFNLGIQVAVAGTITYSWQTTLDSVFTVLDPLVFTPIAAMTGAAANQLANYTTPTAWSRIAVTASTGASTLTETICQQGLR